MIQYIHVYIIIYDTIHVCICNVYKYIFKNSQILLFVLSKLLFQSPKLNEYISYLAIPHESFSFARFGITLKTSNKLDSDNTKILFYYLLLHSSYSCQYLFQHYKSQYFSDSCIFLVFYVYFPLEPFCNFNLESYS